MKDKLVGNVKTVWYYFEKEKTILENVSNVKRITFNQFIMAVLKRINVKNYIVVGFMISIMSCYGQSNNQLNDLLNESIEKYRVSKSLDQMFFLKDNIPLDFYFDKIITDNCEITFFNKGHYRKSELQQGIRSIRLLPINLKNNKLMITISNVLVSQKRNNTTISSGDYVIYEYRYSCEKDYGSYLKLKKMEYDIRMIDFAFFG